MSEVKSNDPVSHNIVAESPPRPTKYRKRHKVGPWGHMPLDVREDVPVNRSIAQLTSDASTPSDYSTANPARHSASPALSNKRPFSPGALEYVLKRELHSHAHSGPEASSSEDVRFAQMQGHRRSRLAGNEGFQSTSNLHSPPVVGHVRAKSATERGQQFSKIDLRNLLNSSPPVNSHSVSEGIAVPLLIGLQPANTSRFGEPTDPQTSFPKVSTEVCSRVATEETPRMLLQLETHSVREEQLINELRGIYAGLVMVEKKCIEIDKQQLQAKHELTYDQWQALIALHRQLLYEHHDFFMASQHPSASESLKRLAKKYAMPARMWRYGIHAFLELLRHKLPQSFEFMLRFLYFAYSMMTLLFESVPAFEETWIECLGDLARYRMAIEEVDTREREIFCGLARYWYNQVADKNPGVGRIQHHLAVLSAPDVIQALFYYTKSLLSVNPFASARESVLILIGPVLDHTRPNEGAQYSVSANFITAHGCLFMESPIDQFISSGTSFLLFLDEYIGRNGLAFRLQGAYICSCNIAAMLEYGKANAGLSNELNEEAGQRPLGADSYKTALQHWEYVSAAIRHGNVDSAIASAATPTTKLFSIFFAFSTLSVIINRRGDTNVFPAVHISLAFIWCHILNGDSIADIERAVPWNGIASFLTSMSSRWLSNTPKIESDAFPRVDEADKKQLPEDFLMRGQAWSRYFFPKDFFDNSVNEDEGRFIEVPSITLERTHRCLWLGVRIATLNRWITYDSSTKSFSTTALASAFDAAEGKFGPFSHLFSVGRISNTNDGAEKRVV